MPHSSDRPRELWAVGPGAKAEGLGGEHSSSAMAEVGFSCCESALCKMHTEGHRSGNPEADWREGGVGTGSEGERRPARPLVGCSAYAFMPLVGKTIAAGIPWVHRAHICVMRVEFLRHSWGEPPCCAKLQRSLSAALGNFAQRWDLSPGGKVWRLLGDNTK